MDMKGGLGKIMQQAQEMQAKMQEAQKEIANLRVTGEAGAGLVKITMTGKHDVTKVVIDPSLLKEDKEMLEDLIAAAVNDAVRKVEVTAKEKMAKLTAGMQLPPGFDMPTGGE